jgi:hypothetical protein
MAEKWEKTENWNNYTDSGGQYAFDEEMLNRAFEEAKRIYKAQYTITYKQKEINKVCEDISIVIIYNHA